MDSRELTAFCRVYEEKGINKAAKRLFISSQGLSRMIQNLEMELGTSLFVRKKQGMQPTPAADYLYEKAVPLIGQMAQLICGVQQIAAAQNRMQIGFSIGALSAIDLTVLEKVQEGSEIEFVFHEDENSRILEMLQNGEVDLAFLVGTVPSSSKFSKLRVSENHLEALVYEGHRYYERESICISDLREEPLILLNEKFHSHHSLLQRTQDLGFSPNIVFQVMDPSLIRRFVHLRAGIGIDVNVHEERRPGIRRIPLEDSVTWNVYATWSTDHPSKVLIEQILDSIFPVQQ